MSSFAIAEMGKSYLIGWANLDKVEVCGAFYVSSFHTSFSNGFEFGFHFILMDSVHLKTTKFTIYHDLNIYHKKLEALGKIQGKKQLLATFMFPEFQFYLIK